MIFFGLVLVLTVIIPVNAEPEPELRTDGDSKIHSVLLRWISSDSPEEYALANDLSEKNGKIHVYIYLHNSTDIAKIPQEIDVFASYDNVAEAFVDKEQLIQLSMLEYVKKITPPIPVKTSQIPLKEQNTYNEIEIKNYLVFVLISIIIVLYLLYRRKKSIKPLS